MSQEKATPPLTGQKLNQSKDWTTYVVGLAPILGVVFLLLIYVVFYEVFVYCAGQTKCVAVDGTQISIVLPTATNLAKDRLIIAESTLDDRHKTQDEQVQSKQAEIDATKLKIKQMVAASSESGTASDANSLIKLKELLEIQKAEQVELTSQRNAIDTEKVELRKNISQRYSFRLMWVFVAAIFFGLCLTGIGVSLTIIWKFDRTFQFWFTVGASIMFPMALFIGVGYGYVSYMGITGRMFDQSLFTLGDLSEWTVNILNVTGFAAIICVTSASSVILASVVKPNPVTVSIGQLSQRDLLKVLLFLCVAMFFVGMTQMKMLGDWHLIFISGGPTSEWYKLLQDYFKSWINVQAGFYALVLGMIYVPTYYAISQCLPLSSAGSGPNDQNGQPTGAGTNDQNVQSTGTRPKDQNTQPKTWTSSLIGLLPHVLAILSPFMAGPLIDIIKHFAGTP